MRVYVGQTRSRALIAELTALGFGECTQPREVPPRRRPWFLDNAAFSAWRAGQPFDEAGFLSALTSDAVASSPPDFVVCPDIVAGGLESLSFSLGWLERCASTLPGQRFYLAVQNGMTEADVLAALDGFAGIFVGGDLPWKIRTSAAWVGLAHRHGLPCHIGRVGTARRVAWARRIGADSIDSCLPLWSRANLTAFVTAVRSTAAQMEFAP